jgi:hypothetical protein
MEFVKAMSRRLLILVAYVGPFFLIPKTFKWAGGVFANLAGIVNDKERGPIDRMRNAGKQRRETNSNFLARQGNKKEKAERRARIGDRRRLTRRQVADELSKGNIRGAARVEKDSLKEDWGARVPFSERRKSMKDAEKATLEAEVAKGTDTVRAGYAAKQASDIKAQAETFQAHSKIDEIRAGLQSQINPNTGVLYNSADARKDALQKFADDLQKKMLDGETTGAEVTGGITALAQQKAGKQVIQIGEAIAGASASNPNALRASTQLMDSYGNGACYSAVTEVNPAIAKAPLTPGMGVNNLKLARGQVLSTEQTDKLVGMGETGWEDLANYAQQVTAQAAATGATPTFTIQDVADRYEQIFNMGGPASAGLSMPGAPSATNPKPYVDDLRNELRGRGILL